jgi:hypothetical protein
MFSIKKKGMSWMLCLVILFHNIFSNMEVNHVPVQFRNLLVVISESNSDDCLLCCQWLNCFCFPSCVAAFTGRKGSQAWSEEVHEWLVSGQERPQKSVLILWHSNRLITDYEYYLFYFYVYIFIVHCLITDYEFSHVLEKCEFRTVCVRKMTVNIDDRFCLKWS